MWTADKGGFPDLGLGKKITPQHTESMVTKCYVWPSPWNDSLEQKYATANAQEIKKLKYDESSPNSTRELAKYILD